PALRKELESGKTPPYEFGCTLGRADINNFTAIFTGEHRAHFMGSINEFFIGVTHIVSRYGGYVHEFVGDEVLFYFKDEDHENSAAIGLSALRDICDFANELSERTQSEAGYDFRVKSSLATGILRFGPLVDAFALAGPPLIETVRMLSHVHEKSENTILFDDLVQERTSFLCRSLSDKVVMLKGLQGARRLHRYQAHTPLSLHLRQGEATNIELTTFYRSDDEICEILAFVRDNVDKLPSQHLNKLLSLFKRYRVTRSSTNVRRSYLGLLENFVEKVQTNSSEENHFLLATLVAAASHLFTAQDMQGDLRVKMLECLKVESRRVVANTLDVFADLDPMAGEQIFQDLMQLNDNRIAANSLVKEGRRAWDAKTARKLDRMLTVQSPYFKASALYALGEIAVHQKKSDPVAFAADDRLEKQLAQLPKFAFHANLMVRRQALKAIEKCDRTESLETAFKMSQGKLDQAVRADVVDYLARVQAPSAPEQQHVRKLRAV
ncbi:MAG TPA: hypothetical protein VM432_08165, partial [Bdellovibrionales bacterium]|nr:hypothetical protein [Bdellovibrionales bacterium]